MADKQLQVVITAKDEASKIIKGFGDKMKEAQNASTTFATGLGIVGGGVLLMGKQMLQSAGDIETARIGFKTLLGTTEEADKALKMIQKDAASTPFEFKGLVDANKLLTSFTGNAQRSEEMLLNVGKALSASGKGQVELDRIVMNLQQIGNVGKVSAIDIKQFGFAGVDVLKVMSEYYGTTKGKAQEMLMASNDGFADLEAGFNKAGSAGGRFADAYANANGSLNQLISNMKDNFNMFLANQGAKFLEWGKDLLVWANKFLSETLPKWIDKIGELIKWFSEHNGALAILIGTIVGALIPAIYATVIAFVAMGVALAPFMVAGAIIGGLIYAIMQLSKEYGGFTNMLTALFGFIEAKTGVLSFLKKAWDDIVLTFKMLLMPALQELWIALQPITPFLKIMAQVLGVALYVALLAVVTIIKTSVIVAIQLLTMAIEFTTGTIKAFGAGWDWLVDKLSNVIVWIEKAISAFSRLNIVQGAQNMISSASSFISGKKALGGSVNAGSSYLVGERGMEIFTPSTSGTITPNNKIGGAGGQIVINVSGNTLLDEYAGEKIGDLIMKKLKYNLSIA